MTFNIRHARGLDERIDLDRILAIIVKSDAAVVALQEVDRFMFRSGHIDQVTELARALGMDWRYAASLRHGRSEYGNAILSRYLIKQDEVIYFPGEKERRTMLKVEIHAEGLGCLCVMTTHLGVTERDLARQAPLLFSQLMKVNGTALLMGDFNMESKHALMKSLVRLGWQEVEPDEQGSGTVIGGRTIDHIYVRNVEGVYSAYTIPTVASDHSPVVLEIT